MKRFNVMLLVALLIGALSVTTGCGFDRNYMRSHNPVAPTPPDSTQVEVCDTTWTAYRTNDVQVSPTNRTGTRIEGLTILCQNNLVRYGAVVWYSDTYDQKLQFFFEKIGDKNVRYYLADSLGRTSVPQPTNYKGKRYMMLTASNIPPGQYAFKMYYAGTVTAPTRVTPTTIYGTLWHVDTEPDTLRIGCIDCRWVTVPIP